MFLNGGSGGRELYYYDNAGSRYMAVTYDTWDVANPPANPVPDRIRVWLGGAEIWYERDPYGSSSFVAKYPPVERHLSPELGLC